MYCPSSLSNNMSNTLSLCLVSGFPITTCVWMSKGSNIFLKCSTSSIVYSSVWNIASSSLSIPFLFGFCGEFCFLIEIPRQGNEIQVFSNFFSWKKALFLSQKKGFFCKNSLTVVQFCAILTNIGTIFCIVSSTTPP